jgi:hypothetical protein
MPEVTELRRAMQARVPADEVVLGAFVGIRGPRPGVEAFAGFAFVAGLLLTSSYWVAIPISVAVFVAVNFARRYVTVARTDRSVLLLENGRRSSPPADAEVTRLPMNSITASSDAGDPSVSVGYARFWVNGSHQDEARRLFRLQTPQSQ